MQIHLNLRTQKMNMKPIKYLLIIIAVLCIRPAIAQHEKNAGKSSPDFPFKLQNATDSLSYAMGLNYAQWMKQQGIDSINYAAFDLAMETTLQNDSALMDQKAAYLFIQDKFRAMMEVRAEKNLEKGEKFLAENKTKPGVISLPDGLEYKILQEGSGPKPTATDKVKVNYSGYLINGELFDSSAKHGQPMEFVVSTVIKGWSEALQLMPVGSKWRLFIPASLAYGSNTAGMIPANSVLIFDVELLGISQ
jgi:FKBP-type peptidyl-prolyl cis-trans isomerase FklB